MLEQIRSLIAEAIVDRESAQDRLTALLDSVETEGRSDLTPEEVADFDAARNELREIDERLTELRAQEADMSEQDAIQTEAAEVRSEIAKAADIRVGAEARTYHRGGEHNFLADALAARKGDLAAADRIERNRVEMEMEHRSTSGAFGSLVTPQYMLDLFAPVLRGGRPFLSAVNNVPLPEIGMTITIPRGVTGTTVAAQTTENTAVSVGTETFSDLVIPVRTFSGQAILSKQSVQRGQGTLDIVLQDLFADYALKTNASAINGDGTAGGHWGILNTTSVQTASWASTTAASLISSIHNAIGKINSARYAPADLIVMHPRRWAWLCAQSDTAGRPLVQIDGPGFNAQGNGVASGYGQVGSIAGIRVITDASVPVNLGASTDEDRIIVTRAQDVYHMEAANAPVGLELEEVLADQLSVRLVAFGYSAFTAGRTPVSTCVVTGTGFKNVLS